MGHQDSQQPDALALFPDRGRGEFLGSFLLILYDTSEGQTGIEIKENVFELTICS